MALRKNIWTLSLNLLSARSYVKPYPANLRFHIRFLSSSGNSDKGETKKCKLV